MLTECGDGIAAPRMRHHIRRQAAVPPVLATGGRMLPASRQLDEDILLSPQNHWQGTFTARIR
jgi:hypothetical protein